MSRRVQVLLGIALAVVLLLVFFRQADFAAIGNALRRADYGIVAVAAVLSVVAMVLRAWRWGYLLRPLERVGMGTLTSCTMIGWAVTTLLPGRLGEVVRPVLLARRERISASAAFATVVLERIFDLVGVLAILAVYLSLFPLPPALDAEGEAVIRGLRLSGLLAVVGVVGILAVIAAMQLWPRRAEAVLQRLLGILPRSIAGRLFALLRTFITGFGSLGRPRLVALIILQTGIVWGVILAQYAVLFVAFELELPTWAVLPLVLLIVIGVMVPTPGAVGSFHVAAEIGLVTLFAVPRDVGVAYAILSHAVAFVPVTLIGIGYMFREGLSLASVRRLGDRVPDPAAAGPAEPGI